jgi:ribonuclease T1
VLHKFGLAITLSFVTLFLTLPGSAVQAKGPNPPIDAVALSQLPPEAQSTERLIRAGGPFPYPRKDGAVFGNRERMLALKPRGFYREYTVKTPGSRDRGAKRIVCGGRQPTEPEACFYTDDHYASFRRIVQ